MTPADAAPAAFDALARVQLLLGMGGAAMWAIAALSVATLALIFWKTWVLLAFGAWSGGGHSARALAHWAAGREAEALAELAGRSSLRANLARAAMQAARHEGYSRVAAEAETARVARGLLQSAGAGLRGLELAATIGPLLGLLGTITGMIAAFQALQMAGARADPATLAGGIWEALLTTAAGMAVAIPAQVALTWFESVVDRLRHDMEDAATQVFLRAPEERR
ncbi:MotA/TolQ/ExbB proton channel family protein [Phaeovulum sp.]|uniref:MotA/TolQ/ExbB proton channel family protein n=1 Tax=Phaeovulum sp. TaxID=2934796 RepID=UPI00273199F9|nr:MotA/TolQ/ExbB proton channel family protein [Phaeovulum sp.]MDP1667646.1 MotA/TolQ/ExbB proton channel family protein [Phaeovulum sp.]MDZ4118463.1 MotA/TolQ/ExbB proton channel family protein [Phaeovulum sp.]